MQIHYGEKGNPRRYCGIKSILGIRWTTDWKKVSCWNCRIKKNSTERVVASTEE